MLRNCLDMAAWDGSSRHPRVTRERRANIEHSKGARVVCNLRRSVNVLEQVRVLNAKALRDLDEIVDGHVPAALFDIDKVRALDTHHCREFVLREALAFSQISNP